MLILRRLLHEPVNILVDYFAHLSLCQHTEGEASRTVLWPLPGPQSLVRLSFCLQGEAVHMCLGDIHTFHVRTDDDAEERTAHRLELGLLLLVCSQIQVAGVDLELWMTVIPGKLHYAISVDLLVDSNLLGVTDLAVA